MIVVVTLDLLGPSASYDPLYEAIKTQGTWAHYMRYTWLLDTEKTPDQLVDLLKPHIQHGDKMLISPLTWPYQGLLQPEAWTWIKARINQPLAR